MNLADTARVLTLASGYDNRRVDETVAIAWHAIIGPLALDDALAVVREHYTRTRDWIMPADIVDGVKRLRADRLHRTIDPVPDVDPDNPRAYVEQLRANRLDIADGHQPPPERLRLEGGHGLPDGFDQTFRDTRAAQKHEPTAEQLEASAADQTRRAAAEAAARAEIARLHQQHDDRHDDQGDEHAEGSPS